MRHDIITLLRIVQISVEQTISLDFIAENVDPCFATPTARLRSPEPVNCSLTPQTVANDGPRARRTLPFHYPFVAKIPATRLSAVRLASVLPC
jgi:hypothetical protein